MSGLKTSRWTYEQNWRAAEQARRQRLAEEARRRADARRAFEDATARAVREQVDSSAPELQRLADQLSESCRLVDPATRRAYGDEIGQMTAVVAEAGVVAEEAQRLGSLSGSELVRQGFDASAEVFIRMGTLLSTTRQLVERAEIIRFFEGPARQRELAVEVGGLAALIARASSEGLSSVADWSHQLDHLRQDLAAGNFDTVQSGAISLRTEVLSSIEASAAARERMLERRAVLDALRDSCRDLRYRELNPAELERSLRDLDADWTLVVDTRTKGRITFTIEADTIRAETGMGVHGDAVDGDYCFTEFARIEAELAEQHGLVTKFTSGNVTRPGPPSGTAKTHRAMGSAARSHTSGAGP
ncbi:MAG: hypothetical protein M0Z88_09645 [Actinomycetota bacterium]|nr:hypothetical protein [Actinomycetota bacterium]